MLNLAARVCAELWPASSWSWAHLPGLTQVRVKEQMMCLRVCVCAHLCGIGLGAAYFLRSLISPCSVWSHCWSWTSSDRRSVMFSNDLHFLKCSFRLLPKKTSAHLIVLFLLNSRLHSCVDSLMKMSFGCWMLINEGFWTLCIKAAFGLQNEL